ncbi:unnamed protein product [Vitrella brassicaformis CCMP3155]|uniref:J domain-containing protein n=1 Tax=Vitrella brassicaformis (strain CCMP3155) TaxID=1169540 RepID=A0A0G4FJC5_VITBC|nr:unnamed protein product [Vitrella brassicaformis CCMP3155]|eukprot:CEM13187.1 unnamed protein product [Vitrella brassicaformis CCMP3155]
MHSLVASVVLLCLQKYHPDKGGDVEKMKEINEAYQAIIAEFESGQHGNTDDTECDEHLREYWRWREEMRRLEGEWKRKVDHAAALVAEVGHRLAIDTTTTAHTTTAPTANPSSTHPTTTTNTVQEGPIIEGEEGGRHRRDGLLQLQLGVLGVLQDPPQPLRLLLPHHSPLMGCCWRGRVVRREPPAAAHQN